MKTPSESLSGGLISQSPKASKSFERPLNADDDSIWTVQKVLNWSADWLNIKGLDRDAGNPRLEVELLLAHVLGCDRMHLYLQLEKPLVRLERDEFKGLLRRRASGEPIAYILGYRDFYRHRFKVTRAVLVPRPDTEILVERALELLVGVPSPTILEIGTGSGCIGISLAMSRSDAQVLAWDSSLDALLIAEENARLLECKQIAFENRDLFEGSMTEPVNLIVSNPPYISSGEAQELSVSVREFEPAMALFDSSSDGLSFYRYLAQHAGSWLLPAGVLVVECGHTQAKAVKEIFRINDLTELTITNDLAGKERVVSGRVP